MKISEGVLPVMISELNRRKLRFIANTSIQLHRQLGKDEATIRRHTLRKGVKAIQGNIRCPIEQESWLALMTTVVDEELLKTRP